MGADWESHLQGHLSPNRQGAGFRLQRGRRLKSEGSRLGSGPTQSHSYQLSDSSDSSFPDWGRGPVACPGGWEAMAQGIEGERGGRERTRLPGRESSAWRMALNSGKKFLNQECHRAAGHQPHPSATPHIHPSCPDQRAPLRQGALVQGMAASGREMMRSWEASPAKALVQGQAGLLVAPFSARWAFSCPSGLARISPDGAEEGERSQRSSLLCLAAGGGAELGFMVLRAWRHPSSQSNRKQTRI